MKRTYQITVIVLLCLIAGMLVMIMVRLGQINTSLSTQQIAEAIVSRDAAIQSSEQINASTETDTPEGETNQANAEMTAPDGMVKIDAPYCTIWYPEEYYEYLKVYEKEENGIYTQEYCCTVGETEVELFAVYFGDSQIGNNFGYLNNNGTMVPVYISFYEVTRDEFWSDDEYFIISAMQESVNDVIQSVTLASNYVKGE